MSKPVKISVIIPIYNVEEFLYCSLGSCAQQTLRDVEFICINDGSTDRSLEIAREFEAKDDRFIVIDKPNGGVSTARNAGLDAASGEFIMFLDADDKFKDKACERVWQEVLEGPTDIIVFSSAVFPTFPRPIPWYYSVLCAPTRRYWEFTPEVFFDVPSTRPFIWHQAFRKSIIDQHNIRFPEGVALGEDTMFLMSVYPHARYFAFIQDTLHCYRWFREGSAMFKADADYDAKISDDIAVIEKVCGYWHNQGWIEKYSEKFLGWVLDFVCYTIRDHKTDKSSQHYKRLAEIIKSYGLRKSMKSIDLRHKQLARPLKKYL